MREQWPGLDRTNDGVRLIVRGNTNCGLRSMSMASRRRRGGILYGICDDRCLVENIDLALRSRRYEDGTELSRPSSPFGSVVGWKAAEDVWSLDRTILSVSMDGSGVDGGTMGNPQVEALSSVYSVLLFGRRLETETDEGPPTLLYELFNSLDSGRGHFWLECMAREAAAAACTLATSGLISSVGGR